MTWKAKFLREFVATTDSGRGQVHESYTPYEALLLKALGYLGADIAEAIAIDLESFHESFSKELDEKIKAYFGKADIRFASVDEVLAQSRGTGDWIATEGLSDGSGDS